MWCSRTIYPNVSTVKSRKTAEEEFVFRFVHYYTHRRGKPGMVSTAVTRQGPQHNITITIHSRRSVTRTSRRKLELLPSLPIRNAARIGYEHFMPSKHHRSRFICTSPCSGRDRNCIRRLDARSVARRVAVDAGVLFLIALLLALFKVFVFLPIVSAHSLNHMKKVVKNAPSSPPH